MRIVSIAEMRELEAQTFAQGMSEDQLQRRAARAIASVIAEEHPAGGYAVAFVGPGNNGRDAFLAIGDLQTRGWLVGVYLSPRHGVTPSELSELIDAGGRIWWHVDGQTELALRSALYGATVAVDGLLGIGAKGEPRPPLDEMVRALNGYRRRHAELVVIAVDTPSGLDSDRGEAAETTVRADLTVVLGGAKRGLLTPSAATFIGRLHFADIGVVEGPPGAAEVLTEAIVAPLYQPRRPEAHKGTSGRALIIAGSEKYLGAAYLCSAAAVRAGAGIVTLAAPRWLRDVVANALPEITYLPLPDSGPAGEAGSSAAVVTEHWADYAALAIGPGLSAEGGVGNFVEQVLRSRAGQGPPAVVDADALNALAGRPGWWEWIGPNVIMTPHPGELRRLAGPELDPNRPPWDAARDLSGRWGVTLVAKGAITSIGAGRDAWVLAAPNPALGTGGTGDVLTGILTGLLARGLSPAVAARVGVWVHSVAGARAAIRGGSSGLAASDLLPEIPAALATLEHSAAR